MASVASGFPIHSRVRVRPFLLPREHGAWGMLLIPLMTGAWVGLLSPGNVAALVWFTVACLALFCLRTPAEAWLEASPLRAQSAPERRVVRLAVLGYASVAGVALGFLLFQERIYGLLGLGTAVAGLFVAQLILKKLGRQNRVTAQLLGSLGLTSTAAGAYLVVTGQLDAKGLVVWAANWVFAINQIYFVQLRIHAAKVSTRAEKVARGKRFLLGQCATAILLILAWQAGVLPALALLAFGPVLARGLAWFLQRPAQLEIHKLGFTELGHALIFAALLILGYQGTAR